jgi:hypothetical protein
MKPKDLSRAILIAWIIVAGVEGTWLFGRGAAAQTSQAQGRNLPMFEVDPSWPKVPAKWKLRCIHLGAERNPNFTAK